jgi:DNA (cytosine-5)-methyltransferase 1
LEGDPREVLFHGNSSEDDRAFTLDEAAHGFYWTEGSKGLGWGEDCIPTLKGGSAIGIPAAPAILLPDLAVVTPEIRDGERFQGFVADWTNVDRLPMEFGGRDFNHRRRWMLVGNAVNVDVSTWIGTSLARRRKIDDAPGSRMSEGEGWPAAAWYDGRTRRKAELSAWPVKSDRPRLATFLKFPGKPLSVRATAGFLSRAERSRLNFVPGFLNALKRHLGRMQIVESRMRHFVKVRSPSAKAA